MIAVDVTDERADHDRLRAYIKETDDFSHWWNHLPSLYLVQSPLTAEQISKRLEAHLNSARYLVVRVDLRDSQGLLPERAWHWIQRRETHDANGYSSSEAD